MFAGLDDIDWGSLRHAYGTAEDVPGWVRGLADPDPAVREVALDAMYGAVHHQGDIYDSTVAAVPYLIEALTTPELPGRDGIVELLASIAEIGEWPDDPDRDEDDAEMCRQASRAHVLVTAAAPRLLRLADDPSPLVRAAAPKLLVALGPAIPDLPELLLRLHGTEVDVPAKMGLLDALGGLPLDDGTVGRLLELAESERASMALAALIAVTRARPHRVPLDGVTALIERAYAEEGPAAEPGGFQTDTLIGSLRVLAEERDEGRRAPHCARRIEDLTDPLGSRVPERITILTPLLASAHDDLAGDALYAANKMIDSWRGDYRDTVAVIAGFLDRSRQLAGQAARMLKHWGPVAAPAADTVAGRLASIDARPWRDGLPDWALRSTLHPYLEILAGLGDERALPLLLTALTLPQRPKDTGYRLARYPGHGARITAAILPHLPVLAEGEREPTEWYAFHGALRAFGADAAPAVPRLLAAPMREWSATTLGRIGPAAAEAVPALRRAVSADDPRLAAAAAGALWRIDRAPDAAGLLAAHLDGPGSRTAFEELAAMGPAAAAVAPLVVTHLGAPPEGHWWTPVLAALALWHITGDTDRTVPVLTGGWHGNPLTRPAIAAAATGPLAAALEPLLHAELAAHQRFNVRPGSWSSSQVTDDEQLRDRCRSVLRETR
ncbi:hypothetical protein GCM10009828_099070 [Actinoplanes couchii]|uniref:PBS lyase HEAT domain protein repeat-containing protein n=2 Tax=Actinoplanes couchii TaxID=403638 RepID=A0ABQ3XPL2_9ACTN|nr:hypothetical protein Aco03nite_088560 [Actinoplanes couchii]